MTEPIHVFLVYEGLGEDKPPHTLKGIFPSHGEATGYVHAEVSKWLEASQINTAVAFTGPGRWFHEVRGVYAGHIPGIHPSTIVRFMICQVPFGKLN